ncbi:MAG: hypothetical protein M3017_17005 [Actinomycetota bacterium]|nr:hypothetical protein [Actinomycetota bacterium]
MLLPGSGKGAGSGKRKLDPLRVAADFMSPIKWLDARCSPAFVTTPERNYEDDHDQVADFYQEISPLKVDPRR